MSYYCYIIYSKKLDRFYVGESEDPAQRLFLHNTAFFKGCFTSQTNDWEFFHVISCETREEARRIESHIKKMKSRKYFENLLKYPEITGKLKLKYKIVPGSSR